MFYKFLHPLDLRHLHEYSYLFLFFGCVVVFLVGLLGLVHRDLPAVLAVDDGGLGPVDAEDGDAVLGQRDDAVAVAGIGAGHEADNHAVIGGVDRALDGAEDAVGLIVAFGVGIDRHLVEAVDFIAGLLIEVEAGAVL